MDQAGIVTLIIDGSAREIAPAGDWLDYSADRLTGSSVGMNTVASPRPCWNISLA
jgi:hypothetical protein